MRDSESVANALQLSMSGHNLFSTVHITTAFDFFNRIKEFGGNEILALNNTRMVIVQQLVTSYVEEKGKKLTKSTPKPGSPVYDSIIDYLATGKTDITLDGFHGRFSKYAGAIRRNILIPESEKAPILDALSSPKAFADYLAESFPYYAAEDEKGMSLVYEFLNVNERNKELILKREDFFEKDDTFLPMFVVAFFLKRDIALSDVFELSKIVY